MESCPRHRNSSMKPVKRKMWCESVWTKLSLQTLATVMILLITVWHINNWIFSFIMSKLLSLICFIHCFSLFILLPSSFFLYSLPLSYPSLPFFYFSEIGAVWNSNQGSIKPRAMDPWNWFSDWCLQAEKEGIEESLSQGHWANVWGQIKWCSLIYICTGGGLMVFQFYSLSLCWSIC